MRKLPLWPAAGLAAVLAVLITMLALPVQAVANTSTSPIRINEVESSGGTPGDWVEIINTGVTAFDVDGWTVRDDDDTHIFVISSASVASTTIEPGGLLVLDVETAFGLGGNDEARLFDTDLNLIDSYSWTSHAATTYGRCPDGTGDFITTYEPTRGTANACEEPEPELPGNLVINEVESSGGTPGDWVELYNKGDQTLDLSGVVFSDSNDSNQYTIADGTTLAAGGYLVLDEADFGFGLGGGDSARIFTSDMELIDSYTWTSHAATTYGRCPNGTGDFDTTLHPTKGAANDCATIEATGVVINEVESNGGVPGDWIELTNLDDTPVDVSGWVIKDNDDSHAAVLPAGTTIAPGEFFIIEEAFLDYGLGSGDSVRVFDTDGVTLIDHTTWVGHSPTTWGRCPDGTGEFAVTTTSTKGAPNDCSAPLRINEVESSGGDPGDWIELINVGFEPVDPQGFTLKDNNDSNAWTFGADRVVAPGERIVIDESEFGFGLGGNDSVRLFDSNDELLDETSWTSHAAVTWGRCPDGTGDFAETSVSTKGGENLCPGDVPAVSWPGSDSIDVADELNVLGGDISGLTFTENGDGVSLWAVDNGNGRLFKLTQDNGIWVPETGWESGSTLRYPNGTGSVDAEGVGFTTAGASGGVYVASERNNDASSVSRPSVLRYEAPATGGGDLVATQEWNLATDLPGIGANSGLEGIAWIPDSQLVAEGLIDALTGQPYDPADYPGHGDGLFFVAVEAGGMVYGYALLDNGDFKQVTSFESGFAGAMELEFDPNNGDLWVLCDEVCNGRTAIHRIVDGEFTIQTLHERPTGMPNIANEGFALVPNSQCVEGSRQTVWSDDDNTDGHALRAGSVNCVASSTPGDGDGDGDDGGSGDDGGDTVRAWLHSTPMFLGEAIVAADGTIQVQLPADAPAGSHRIVITDAAGNLIGWDSITLAAAATDGTTSAANQLARTDGEHNSNLAILGFIVLAAGVSFLTRRRED